MNAASPDMSAKGKLMAALFWKSRGVDTVPNQRFPSPNFWKFSRRRHGFGVNPLKWPNRGVLNRKGMSGYTFKERSRWACVTSHVPNVMSMVVVEKKC